MLLATSARVIGEVTSPHFITGFVGSFVHTHPIFPRLATVGPFIIKARIDSIFGLELWVALTKFLAAGLNADFTE